MHFLFYGADAPHPNRTLLRLVRGICFKRITNIGVQGVQTR